VSGANTMAGVTAARLLPLPLTTNTIASLGDVLFIEDVARVLRTSRSTIERRRRSGTFPIPELPAIDERPRWSRQAVERYLASTDGGLRPRRGRPRARVQ